MFFKVVDNKWLMADTPLQFIIRNDQIINRDRNELFVLSYGVLVGKGVSKTLVIGTPITTVPDTIEEHADGKYSTLHYKKGGVFSKDIQLLMESTHLEFFFKLLAEGKMNEKIPYKDQVAVIVNMVENTKHLEVAPVMYEILVSAVYRGSDPTKLFRLTKGSKYKSLSFRELVSQSGTFAAATFEDPISMNFINVTRKKTEETHSPLEEYMKL